MRADLSGCQFGSLTAVRYSRSVPRGAHSTKIMWECQCACGNITEVFADNLRSGNTISCGCLQGKRVSPSIKACWAAMWARCTNPKHNRWEFYGGRGIRVCRRWRSLSLFCKDMGPRPSPLHSIGRIHNDRDYKPSNCLWCTPSEQQRNKGDFNVLVPLHGKLVTVAEWSDTTGGNRKLVYKRIYNGWSPVRAVEEPVRRAS